MVRKWIFVPLITGTLFYAQEEKKTFYHQGNFSDRFVTYFTKKPQITTAYKESVIKKNGIHMNGLIINVPEVTYTKGDLDIKTHSGRERGYSIEISNDAKGSLITVYYDPNKIACHHALCDSISGKYGLVITLLHQKNIAVLNNTHNNILQVVSNQNKAKSSPCIVVDAGHGGTNLGKVGCFGIKEKDLTLKLSKAVAETLKKNGFSVYLTRTTDIDVPLDQRTTCANKKKADLFLSIHANSGPMHASGVETYWTARAPLSKEAASGDIVAAIDGYSNKLATCVHKHLLEKVNKRYVIKDRAVKESVAQVLLGTDIVMPAALVEVGFLSNQEETRRLIDRNYQRAIVEGICNGVKEFVRLYLV